VQRLARLVILAVVAAAACGEAGQERVRTGGAARADGALAGHFVVDDRVVDLATGRSIRLAAPAWSLEGPPAVLSPDGKRILYGTFTTVYAGGANSADGMSRSGAVLGRPAVRVAALDGSADVLVAEGAVSPAWGPEGQVTYVQGSDPDLRQDRPFVGRVIVRAEPSAPAEVWTPAPGRYGVIGWAGRRLLVGVLAADGQRADILSLTGPGEATVLAQGEGVLAIAPEGDRALLGGPPPDSAVRVVSLADGSSHAVDLSLDRVGGGNLEALGGASWGMGERVVLVASVDGAPAFVMVDLAALRVEALVRLDGSRFPSVHDPYFLDNKAVVAAWAPNGTISLKPGERPPARPYVLVWCAVAEGACHTRPLPAGRLVARLHTTARAPGLTVEEVAA
jgi:hypothetical protein